MKQRLLLIPSAPQHSTTEEPEIGTEPSLPEPRLPSPSGDFVVFGGSITDLSELEIISWCMQKLAVGSVMA